MKNNIAKSCKYKVERKKPDTKSIIPTKIEKLIYVVSQNSDYLWG